MSAADLSSGIVSGLAALGLAAGASAEAVVARLLRASLAGALAVALIALMLRLAAPPPGTLKRRLLMLDSTTRRPRPVWLGLAGLAALAALVPVRISAAPGETVRHVRGHAAHGSEAAEAYVLLSKDGDTSMSGSTSDVSRARALAGGGPLLWFRRGGREYVVRDPALLARVDGLFAPQRELGKKQGELGAKQGELGSRQGKLGAKQGELGARLGSLDTLNDNGERERRDISRQMEELGNQQEELGRQQEDLGRRQEQLGREQERLAREAEAQLKPLLDDAIARGLAQEAR